ncbi:MAG: diguanylate cyclase [Alphaproteobacteria bacterium]|nr:diguanylate cyclase [Alphaproteobacteria bacterium]
MLLAVMIVHAISWRMMSATLGADEPGRLVTLVGLERSLNALRDAVVDDGGAAAVGNVAAAEAAVIERLRRLRHGAPATAERDAVVGEVERALAAVETWRAGPASAQARRDAEAAVARAHAAVRAGVLQAQQEALAWSRDLDRQVAWIMKSTAVLWSLVAFAAVAVGIAFARLRRRSGRQLRLTEQALVRSEHLAHQDALTGVANRRRFDAEFEAAIRDAEHGPAFALHLLDVDGLKTVNDRCGHAAGDVLLAAVARALTTSVRADDLVARFGGDEFAVIQRDATPETAERLAERLSIAVAVPVTLRDGTRAIPRASGGFALYGADGTTRAALSETADARLYAAKSALSRLPSRPPRLVKPG